MADAIRAREDIAIEKGKLTMKKTVVEKGGRSIRDPRVLASESQAQKEKNNHSPKLQLLLARADFSCSRAAEIMSDAKSCSIP